MDTQTRKSSLSDLSVSPRTYESHEFEEFIIFRTIQDSTSRLGSERTAIEEPHVASGRASQYDVELEAKQTYIDFTPGDPENPLNFSTARKALITFFSIFMTLIMAASASAYSSAIPGVERDFDTSREIAILGLSLCPLGCMYPILKHLLMKLPLRLCF
jgi:hypothetical protein